jgi:hypothetical protein
MTVPCRCSCGCGVGVTAIHGSRIAFGRVGEITSKMEISRYDKGCQHARYKCGIDDSRTTAGGW